MSGAASSLPPPPSAGGNILRYCGEIWRHLRRSRVKAGNGLRLTQTEDGVIVSQLAIDEVVAQHPFKINAAFDFATPTAVLCTVTFGQIGGFTPLFPGSAGDPLSDTPAPVHTIALTADVYYFSLVATVTKDGVLSGAYIDVDTTAPTDTDPVPDDMPDEGDTGTAGEYVFPLGEVEIYEDTGVYSFVVRQTITHSLTFRFCDNSATIMAV